MMLGMIQPTSGNIIINGTDIGKGPRYARNSIGFCLQHNIFFDEFTVREQLQFFTRLKGLSGKDAEKEVLKYLDAMELKSKMNAVTSSLSFGMKRKLSVGLALCGGSRVIFCDEPTSGSIKCSICDDKSVHQCMNAFPNRYGSNRSPCPLESIAA